MTLDSINYNILKEANNCYLNKGAFMGLFNWEDFFDTDKIAVSCKTEEEASDFIKEACKNQKFKDRWYHYGNTVDDTDWYCFQDETCYINCACFTSLFTARSQGYDIVNWSDFMTNIKNPYNLKEKYLKSGYIVKLQDNRTSLILLHENVIYLLDSDNSSYVKFNVEDYDINLINCANPDHTITEIYSQIKDTESVETAIPIWSR